MLKKIEESLENVCSLFLAIIFSPFALFVYGMDNYPLITLVIIVAIGLLIGRIIF